MNHKVPIKPGVTEIAQRKIVNLPYLASMVTIFNWLAASVVIPLMIPAIQTAGRDEHFQLRLFVGILFSGILTFCLLYFNMEIFSRRLWQEIFPTHRITAVKGAWRMKMGTRMIISLAVTGIFPILMLSVVIYNKTRLMLIQDPGALLPSLLAVIFFLLAGSTIATIIVARMASKSIVVPLQNLEQAIRKVENGNFNVKVPFGFQR